MTVAASICAWCGTVLREGSPHEPPERTSHGVCVTCAGAAGCFPVEDLTSLTAEHYDTLPFGVIGLDQAGNIVAYNQNEEDRSGLSRANVLGRNFFREVAPCTQVSAFEGRYRRMAKSGTSDHAVLMFVFRFADGARLVRVSLSYEPLRERGLILVTDAE